MNRLLTILMVASLAGCAETDWRRVGTEWLRAACRGSDRCDDYSAPRPGPALRPVSTPLPAGR